MIEHLLEPGFDGRVGLTVDESAPWWPTAPTPAAGAPNVVLIVLDDVGFAQLGCYGSDIDTPNIDGLAGDGVQATGFHVTPLCSPTRACLLTGRNHHSVGMGMISGFPSGFPSGRESVTHRAAMLPALLRRAGYGTFAVGKWHLAPMAHMTPAGRFDHWPLAHGFDRFYGFLGGETDQYRPALARDNNVIVPPDRPGYHLSEDLVDESISMLTDHRSSAPDRPFFLYLAFGACHGPHQVPEPYRSRYRGRYDDGWDAVRERWHRRQLELGVLPEGTGLAPRNADVTAWEDLAPEDRARFAEFHEVYAGFLEHTDAQVGRLLAALEVLECAEDTMVILISDNGAAGEGGARGSWNELIPFNGLDDAASQELEGDHELGTEETYPLYPRGWAQAGNTPLKWYKHYTHGGGVRTPLVVRWPGKLGDPGRRVAGFQHAIDLTPTVLEAAGVGVPDAVNGVPQMPIHGRSALGLWRGEPAHAMRTQYFEMQGNRGIFHDGWKAVAKHEPGVPFDEDRWELYHLAEDFAELEDLAEREPERLADLKARWWHEAGRFGVTPLDDRFLERAQSRTGTDDEGRTRFVYYRGTARIAESAAAEVRGGDFTITTELRSFEPAHAGVLTSVGGRYSGFVLYVSEGRLCFDYNAYGELTHLSSERELPTGDVVVGVTSRRDGEALEVELVAAGDRVGGGRVPRIVPYYMAGNGVEVGANELSRVSDRYERPFRFSGRFDAVVIEVAPSTDAAGTAAARAAAE